MLWSSGCTCRTSGKYLVSFRPLSSYGTKIIILLLFRYSERKKLRNRMVGIFCWLCWFSSRVIHLILSIFVCYFVAPVPLIDADSNVRTWYVTGGSVASSTSFRKKLLSLSLSGIYYSWASSIGSGKIRWNIRPLYLINNRLAVNWHDTHRPHKHTSKWTFAL